ncbi:timeless protein-domain-containing protein [Umbelopsis sp. AD052]|nr:timeless protein-domain-containing protein [Umbelopsis sp. AD052]
MPDVPELTPEEQLRAEVLSICSALGALEEYQEENGEILTKYAMGDECLACMKDIRKLIRNDSENPDNYVLHLLGEFNIMSTDLIPIVLVNTELTSDVSERLVLACFELFVPMTWPLAENHDENDESGDSNMIDLHRRYKVSLLQSGILEAALDVILKPLSIPFKERAQRDHVVIRLVLTLLRNIAAIPDLNASQSSSESAVEMSTMQEKYLTRLHDSKMLELLVTIASSSNHPDFAEWNVVVMQILFFLLKGSDPTVIAASDSKDNQTQNTVVSVKLAELLQQENRKRSSSRQMGPSRHNRFGGSYSVEVLDGEKYNIHRQTGGVIDLSDLMNNNKREYRVGKKKKLQDKIGTRSPYQTHAARSILYDFGSVILDSAFNALHSSLLKDVERESKQFLEPDHFKFYYVIGWLLQFRFCIHSKWKADVKKQQEKDADKLHLPNRDGNEARATLADNPANFDLVASAMDIRFFLLCVRRMRQAVDEKQWLDVQTCAECFKQMLQTLAGMAESDEEDFAEVAEYVQSNIYYEQSTLDLFIEMVRGYKFQSTEYLKSVVELNHHMLRMLERYASGKKYMFVRKNRKSRKEKDKKAQSEGEENQPDDEKSEDEETYEEERDRKQAYREHQFKFDSFELRFANDEIIRIYSILLEDFQTLPNSTLNAITNFFHRLMVKRKMEHLFFKLPTLELFNRILPVIKTQSDKSSFQQLAMFIRYCIKQYVKHAQENPLFLVESLFKGVRQSALESNGEPISDDDEPVTRLRDHQDSDDSNGEDDQITSYPTTVELEIKPGLTWSQQVGVAIAVLVEDKKGFLVEWANEQIMFAIAKRSSEDIVRISDDGNADSQSVKAYENYDMEATMVAVKSAIRKNAKLRLLLSLLQFEKTEDDYMETTWTIPASMTSETLQSYIDMMVEFVANPLAPNGLPAKDMIKKKAKKKRARKDLDEEDSSQRKRAKKVTAGPVYHTQQFIIDSDGDDDEDFFANERRLREKNMAAFISNNHSLLDRASPDSQPVSSQTTPYHAMAHTTAMSGMATPLDDSVSDDSMEDEAPLFTSGRQVFQPKQQSRASPNYMSQNDTYDRISTNAEKSFKNGAASRNMIFSDDEDDIDEDIDNTVTKLNVQRRKNRAILSDSDEDDT